MNRGEIMSREILFRGFCAEPGGKEVAFYNGRYNEGYWVEGFLLPFTVNCYQKSLVIASGLTADELDITSQALILMRSSRKQSVSSQACMTRTASESLRMILYGKPVTEQSAASDGRQADSGVMECSAAALVIIWAMWYLIISSK